MQSLSVIFIGTGEFGTSILESLVKDPRIHIPFVITGQDKPAGRNLKITSSPVKEAAIANKLIVHQPTRLVELKQKLIQEKPDFLFICAYGEILKKEILEIPKYGAVNIHGSLLPKYRGASPIQETILQGDKTAGVTWILMNEKMDNGNIIEAKEISVSPEDTAPSLSHKLAGLAAQNTARVLIDFSLTRVSLKQNENLASYCRKIKKDNGLLDFHQETAEFMLRKIRAYTPWPGCYILWNKKRLKIITAGKVEQKIGSGEVRVENEKALFIGAKEGCLAPLIVQPESKKPMGIAEFLRGRKKIPISSSPSA